MSKTADKIAPMNILLTGAGGQLGWELQRTKPPEMALTALSSADLDITDPKKIATALATHTPDVIINAAAYTAVDKAESDEERAFLVNGEGPGYLAQAAHDGGIRLIHISTDFIFDGQKSSPYLPNDPPNPLSVYGRSKLLGEERILAINGGQNTTIIRTAWVYSSHGHNFVKTMLRLLQERESLSIIADQIGTPTWAHDLALAVWSALTRGITGTHHWTDAGVASWYDFAVAIMEEALTVGLINTRPMIRPIATADYPLPAKRPPYSVLDKTSLSTAIDWQPSHWRVALRQMLSEL